VKLRVRDADGTRPSNTVLVAHRDQGGRGEAKAALGAWVAETRQAAKLTPYASSWTLGALMDDYMASRERIGRSRTTLESYNHVAARLTPELSSRRLAEVRGDDLDILYGHLAAKGLSAGTSDTPTQCCQPHWPRA